MSSQYPAHRHGEAPAAWNAPYAQPVATPQAKNGIGTAALVLGIIGLVFSVILMGISVFSLILSIPAVVLGGIGIAQASHGTATNRGSAITGLVCGVIAIGVTILMSAVFVAIFG